jgi:hypothetical protein
VYKDDDGNNVALLQDTSNATTAGAALAPLGTKTLARGIKPRYALYKSTDGLYSRRLYIPTAVSPAANLPSFVITTEAGTSVTVNFAGFVKEREVKSGFNSGQVV